MKEDIDKNIKLTNYLNHMLNIFSKILGTFIVLTYYISLVTGFFALYYYDREKYKKIRLNNYDTGYFLQSLLIALYFIINTFITLFYNRNL